MTNDLLKRLRGLRIDGTPIEVTTAQAADEIEQLRGNLSLAEEGLANAIQEIKRLQTYNASQGTLLLSIQQDNERLRVALQKIISEGDYTAPEGMTRIARAAIDGATHEPRACTCKGCPVHGIPKHMTAEVTRLPVPGTQMTRLSDIADELIRQLRKQGMEKMQAVFDGMRLRIDPWPDSDGVSRDPPSEQLYRLRPLCTCVTTGNSAQVVNINQKCLIHGDSEKSVTEPPEGHSTMDYVGQVGCDGPDGLVYIHGVNETCDVCAAVKPNTQIARLKAWEKLMNSFMGVAVKSSVACCCEGGECIGPEEAAQSGLTCKAHI